MAAFEALNFHMYGGQTTEMKHLSIKEYVKSIVY